MWVVPTAPIVSGGMVVPLRNSPGKVSEGFGDEPVAEGGGAWGLAKPSCTTGTAKRLSGGEAGGLIALISARARCVGASASSPAASLSFIGAQTFTGWCVRLYGRPACT